MKKTTKIISTILSVAMTLTMFSGISAFAADNISVELDGSVITFDVNPQIIDGRAMVPLRKIFEEIGALVKWDNDTQTVTARKSSKTITLSIGSAELSIDKGDTDNDGNPILETVTLDVPAQIVSGRTLVPARAISESFGLNVDWDEDNQKVIITSDDDEDDSWKENVGSINLSDLTFEGNGIEIEGNQITITAGGDYTITGTLTDGNITISTKEKVKLRLSGSKITSSENPCIFVEDADKAYITLSDGTENYLIAENSDDGAIYSKENLEIKGDGSLDIESRAGHAIKASDNMTIENGTLNLTASSDGIHINDTFKMTGGTVNITAIGDGIDSESIVNLSGGKLKIETNGVPIVQESTETMDKEFPNNMRGGMMAEAEIEFEKSSKGINAEWMMCISGGEFVVNAASHTMHCEDEIQITGGTFSLSSKYEKGISAHGNLTIDNSDTIIDITKSTEGLESKNIATINDGTIKIIASDDGINSTGGKNTYTMGGGQNMNAGTKKPVMGQNETMPNEEQTNSNSVPNDWGNPDFVSDNVMSGKTEFRNREDFTGDNAFAGGNRGGMGGNQKTCLIVNGGNIEIFADKDCLDANGNMILNGGTIKVMTANGVLTGHDSIMDSDGTTTVSEDVTFVAAGKGGAKGIVNSTQNMITFYSETIYNAGENISITDEAGKTILEYSPMESFSVVFVVSPALKLGQTYTLSVGNESQKLTLNEQNTVIGTEIETSFGWNRGTK